MLFNSYIFILCLLPLSTCGYFILNRFNHKTAQIYLLLMSLWFYGYNIPSYLLIIVSSVIINYFVSILMNKTSSHSRKLLFLVPGLIFDVGILFYYKYFEFTIWNINHFLHTSFVVRDIILPLGISFYSIQQISFLIDSYRDDSVKYNFIDYALYVTFFPQLVAGPIVYHNELISQFSDGNRQKPDANNILYGIIWFTLGLSKKIFIADAFSGGVDYAFDNISAVNGIDVLLVMLSYTLQIYFDFSGYSDMACGIAKMFNFDLPQNFNSPYKAISIQDFWRRWHMTLTRFLTKYIYIPLGGNRQGVLRYGINVMIVFLISGIWHGANYTFILWALLHGLCILTERCFKQIISKIPSPIRWTASFFIINVLWLLFRANGVKEWLNLLKQLLNFNSTSVSQALLESYNTLIPLQYLFLLSMVVCLFCKNNYMRKIKLNPMNAIAAAFLLTLCFLTLNKVSIFLYFNF